jgi:hypothetical protein
LYTRGHARDRRPGQAFSIEFSPYKSIGYRYKSEAAGVSEVANPVLAVA